MTLSPFEEPEPEEAPLPTKRLRWATQRVTGKKGNKKRMSIIDRLAARRPSQNEKNRNSGGADSMAPSELGGIQEEPGEDIGDEGEHDRDGQGPRKIFFNLPLPPEAVDEEGLPIKHYRRNKIRTAKYTPISFVPKNIWYQFHNIANVYFLLLIVLAFFSIFGASNPGLNAVPLIVIVVITAIKDAIEDYRRTVLDNELNNSPVHRLIEWNNVNVSDDDISLWRRIKKATSRFIATTWRKINNKKVPGQEHAERAMDEPRESYETRAARRASAFSVNPQRESFASTRDDIQMTPVPSPLPRPDGLEVPDRPKTAFSYDGEAPAAKHFGSLINPNLTASGNARFHQDYWKNVQVGDFVRLYNDDQIPADIVILSTSDPDGACYVETKNLDGETNLKVRHALRSGRTIKHARDCEKTEFTIESEPPQANLYQYSAVARWNDQPSGQPMAEPISINNLILRGCNLRNTDWILGVVVFTGFDTKIMMNAGITPSKRSRIARELNWNVVYNFGLLVVMCLVSAVIEGVIFGQADNSIAFFEFGSIGNTPGLDGFITFWAALILFQNLVPISLYISLEIVKTCQAFFIYSDTEMYYEKIDYPCTPKSWNISDDLGQIEYIFSDKTGTLTQNVMEFKKATINGVPYGEAYTEAQAGMQKRQGMDVEKEIAKARQEIGIARAKMLVELRKVHNNPYLHDEDLTFVAPDFVTDLQGESGREQQRANEQFMLALALCHTVIAETTPGDPPKIEFKAQSPDEAALVATARDCGYTVLGNSEDGIRLNIQGEDRSYKVLNTLEFNSTRKRMSAIVRMPNNRIVLFCKGADSIIYSRLKRGEQPELRQTTAEHLEMFAREGLRTLCIAQKVLDEEEYQQWNREHELAASAIQDREDKLEAAADLIERDLTLLGGTAIEDRLQEGVPDTIALLAEAGIKLWVLTGDKVETAINIGFSCNLLNNDMELIVFKIEDEQLVTAEIELDKHMTAFGITGSDQELKAARKSHTPPAPTHAVIIDGDSLKLLLDPKLRQKFLLLCKKCKSVLCCRVSPAQKAAVVQMVKNGLDVMTLSIGDGANDVAMIQEADIGVGIAGEEGRQAVMSSDYAIGQFRFLQRLVLVHGRWSYRRLAECIANFFYKNIIWTFTIFWYQIFCNFDMTYLYDYTYILLFNLAFTSLPIIFMGVLDQDVSDKVSLAVPQLYRRGIERLEWTQKKFWLYMLDGFYQSVICFFMAWLLFRGANFVTDNGLNIDDRERFGVYIAPATVIAINVYILLNTYRWDWLMVLLVAISILLVWFWTGVYSAFTSSEYFYKAAPQAFGQASFWALTALSIIMSLLPRFCIKVIQKVYFPYDVDIVREQVRLGKYDYLDKPEINDDTQSNGSSTSSSDMPKPSKHTYYPSFDEDQRPIYPPSVAPTTTTHNNRSQNGSDGTEFTRHRQSLDLRGEPAAVRSSMDDRPRPSFDRLRQSMDRIRPSFEANNDFTSAAMLTRLESSHNIGLAQSTSRGHNVSNEF
ncbi:Phospholipid-transporting ATPase [Lachnellula hyalina]|uniref:Phospholipid-transporting ATPase n=1 Tax=Lachnellula hyalina TaxID=1316788 RepID=A0A8H8R1Q0_9HELO|nr:Phospholipid-transporting ATPase [Lachnellula hyalina]TVY26150.1 Phospholipid-transporting ATPase [Lachnellula hyalina]